MNKYYKKELQITFLITGTSAVEFERNLFFLPEPHKYVLFFYNGVCFVVFNSRLLNAFNNCTFWSIIVEH
jgi:hypothetical protein